MAKIPPVPAPLKSIQSYMKTAAEFEVRDPVITYWCRLYSLQAAMKVDKSRESLSFLTSLMDWLENHKSSHIDNEAISHEVVAQAHIENYAYKVFLWADNQDRGGNFDKNVVKAFYTASILFTVLTTFGELTEECLERRKYAKWKAVYIHNCLKSGEVPVPGPAAHEVDDDDSTEVSSGAQPQPATPPDVVTTNKPAPEIESAGSVSQQVIEKAQQYCKYAVSALNFEDVDTAIVHIQKSLLLLQTGREN